MANEVVIDALPYIDHEYEEQGMREMVNAMVEEEMKRYRPAKNFLEGFPKMELNRFKSDCLQKEYDRLAQGLPMETLSTKRYELPPPPTGKLTDLSAWTECVENSYAQLEHQNIRLCNLELMQEYTCESWKAYLTTLAGMVTQAQKQLADVKRKIQEINWQRKCNQTDAGEKLKSLEGTWVRLVSKNYEIEKVCIELEIKAHGYKAGIAQAKRNNANALGDMSRLRENVPQVSQSADEKMEEDIDGEEIGPQPYFPDADKIENDPERYRQEVEDDYDDSDSDSESDDD